MEETLIALWRHGHTKYKQGNTPCTVESACDLCVPGDHDYETGQKKAEEHIRASARTAIPFLPRHMYTQILSSDTGRGLHTAKCIREALDEEVSFYDLEYDQGIQPYPGLGEVGGFSWQLFEALYKGGRIELPGGKAFDVDPSVTNPRGLRDPDYFYFDEAHRIARTAGHMLPTDLLSLINRMETMESCIDRLLVAIDYATRHEKVRHWIFVTHAGLACYPMRVFTDHKMQDLDRGHWLLIRATPQSAHVVAAQGLPEFKASPDLYTYDGPQPE